MSGLKIKQNCFKVIQMTIYMALCFTTYRMQWIHLTFYWSYKTKFRLDKNVIVFICIKPLESLKAPIWLFMYRNKTTAFYEEMKSLWNSGVNNSRKFLQKCKSEQNMSEIDTLSKMTNWKDSLLAPGIYGKQKTCWVGFHYLLFFYYFQYISFFAQSALN